MKHAFTVKGNVRIVVEFNPNLYNITEVQGLLQWAIQNRNNFEAVQAEIEIQNPAYVEKQIFGSSSYGPLPGFNPNNYPHYPNDEEEDNSEIEFVEEQPLFDIDKDESDNDGTDW